MIKKNRDILINFILDKSGSMYSCQDATISGFNEYKNDQARQEGKTKFSLTLFNTDVEDLCVAEDVEEVGDLDKEDYEPGGMTALYDAVGTTITKVEKRLSKLPARQVPSKVIYVIMTDGLENASREYTHKSLFSLIRKTEKKDRLFVFLGANQDSWAVSDGLGITTSSALNFDITPQGIQNVYNTLITSTTSYRASSGNKKDKDNFWKQDQE